MDGINEVWVVESGEYEQRGIELVDISPEACEVAIKSRYGEPYKVRWEPLRRIGDGEQELVGYFEAVQHFSTTHTNYFTMTRYPLNRLPSGT